MNRVLESLNQRPEVLKSLLQHLQEPAGRRL
jgi:hypothetical protein